MDLFSPPTEFELVCRKGDRIKNCPHHWFGRIGRDDKVYFECVKCGWKREWSKELEKECWKAPPFWDKIANG